MEAESESLLQKRKHLEALEAFIKSPAHAGYKAAIELEIQQSKDAIVAIVPITQEDVARLLLEHGQLSTLESELKRFENARVSLEKRIDEIVEAEQQNATETKL